MLNFQFQVASFAQPHLHLPMVVRENVRESSAKFYSRCERSKSCSPW